MPEPLALQLELAVMSLCHLLLQLLDLLVLALAGVPGGIVILLCVKLVEKCLVTVIQYIFILPVDLVKFPDFFLRILDCIQKFAGKMMLFS